MNSFQLVFDTLCCFFFANHPRLTKTHSFSGVFQNMLTYIQKKMSILEPYPTNFWQPYPPCCSPPIKHCLPCPLRPNNSRFHLRPVKATAPCIRQSRRNLKDALLSSIFGYPHAQPGVDVGFLLGLIRSVIAGVPIVSREIPGTRNSRTPISILLPYHSHSRIAWSMGMVWVPLTWERVPTSKHYLVSVFSWCLFHSVIPFCCW